ncbi:hypothetical protein J3R74_002375 [Puniceicoccus vermicola]
MALAIPLHRRDWLTGTLERKRDSDFDAAREAGALPDPS